jgi:hypothetical protein
MIFALPYFFQYFVDRPGLIVLTAIVLLLAILGLRYGTKSK